LGVVDQRFQGLRWVSDDLGEMVVSHALRYDISFVHREWMRLLSSESGAFARRLLVRRDFLAW
jgi:hypothetical protein